MNRLRARALLVPAAVILTAASAAGQSAVEVWAPAEGYLRIGPEPERRIPRAETGYTLLIPERSVVGVVVFLDSRRFPGWTDPEPRSFDAAALERGLAVMHMTTGDPLDFLFREEDLDHLSTRLADVLRAQGLSDRPIHLAGLSLAGTRALRLRIFLGRQSADYGLSPGAVAVVDSPLDMERLWRSEGTAIIRDFHPAAADEGRWVRYLLQTNLGGTPEVARERYVEYSPFTYSEPGGGSAVALRDVAIRAYHEPDVDWWLEHRRKSYYDMNSLDMAGLIAELHAAGNPAASLVTTHGRREGYSYGSSPHTWSFVDNEDLARWFAEMSESRD